MSHRIAKTARPRLRWHRLEPGQLYIEDPNRFYPTRYLVARHEPDTYDDCRVCGSDCESGPWSVIVESPRNSSEPDPDQWWWYMDDELAANFESAREAKVWAERRIPSLRAAASEAP